MTSQQPSLAVNRRRHEYAFLIGTTLCVAACAIGADLINLWVSSEYFTFGKGLPFDHLTVRVIWLAFRASYWVGAILAVAFLSANSFGGRPPLPIRALCRLVGILLAVSLVLSLLVGGVFALNAERLLGGDAIFVRRPRPFAFVWGFNHGGYLAAILALLGGPIWIVRSRRGSGNCKQAQAAGSRQPINR